MIIYLYIKTHNVTGLKYFGQTVNDPVKYRGSGLHWKRHLKTHGNNVSTEIHGQYDKDTESDKLEEAALAFSEDNNIVESTEWANLMIETGTTDSSGGFRGHTHTQEARDKVSAANRARPPISEATRKKLRDSHLDVMGTDEMRRKLSTVRAGTKMSPETRAKLSAATKRQFQDPEKKARHLAGVMRRYAKDK